MTSVRSSSWSRIVLNPIAWAPELSTRSGGLPPTKRGCSSGRDLRRGRDLDGRSLVGLGEDVGGELDVVDAVAAVEDHRVDGGVLGDAERVGCIDAAAAVPSPPARDGRRADDAGLAEVRRERCSDADGSSAAEESTSVGGCPFDVVLVHVVVHTFLVESFNGWGDSRKLAEATSPGVAACIMSLPGRVMPGGGSCRDSGLRERGCVRHLLGCSPRCRRVGSRRPARVGRPRRS